MNTSHPLNVQHPILLRVRGLTVGYGRAPFVRDLDLDVRAGRIVALLGANGAGKSTTLKGIAGLLKPFAGTVEFDGRISARSLQWRARQGLAYLPQERCVFMGLSVTENLRVGGVDVEEAFERFPELAAHARRRVGLLSGGQQQMLAVARALGRKPRLLLADELSLGLAPLIVDRILQVIRAACHEDGLGAIIVEQQVTKALSIADDAVVIRRGRLVLTGAAADVQNRMGELTALYL